MRLAAHPSRPRRPRGEAAALQGAGRPGQERARHHGRAPHLSAARAGRGSGRRPRLSTGLQALDRGHGLAGIAQADDRAVRPLPGRGERALQVQPRGRAGVLHAPWVAAGPGPLDAEDGGLGEARELLLPADREAPREHEAARGAALGRIDPSRTDLRVTAALTLLALIAFASNSILCRLALAPHEIDPANFTLTRLGSGGLTLLLIHAIVTRSWSGGSRAGARPLGHALIAALLLFLYALPFSLAYVSIGAGAGALILFTAVQATMLLGALRSGE